MNEEKKIGFIYTVEHIGIDGKIKSSETIENVIPLEGINYILNAALKSGAQYGSWYIGLFKANRTPALLDTMTTLLADCEESADYGTTERNSSNLGSVSEGSVTSVSDPAVITFSSATTIQGGFLTSGLNIGNTAGLLISAVKFTSPKVLAAGESLRVPIGMALASL